MSFILFPYFFPSGISSLCRGAWLPCLTDFHDWDRLSGDQAEGEGGVKIEGEGKGLTLEF